MRNRILQVKNIIILSVLSIIAVSPYVVMIISCFSTSAAIKGSIIFSDFSIKNFAHNWNSLVETKNFTSSLSNSILVSTLSSVCGVIIASMAGYAFCIFNNRKNKALFLITSFSMMIPTAAIIVPLFLVFKNTGLLNTYFAVIITSMSIPFLVFLFRQNTKLIPIDIIKSARMDGAYELNIFFRIYVPCMKNVYVAALLISFINAWTSVIFPMILLQSQDRFTFAIFLDSLGSLWYADYAVLMLALLVSSLPILIVYFIFQRQIKSLIGGFGL